jgi:hypothetical protein
MKKIALLAAFSQQAVSVQPSTKSVGITFLDADGSQVQLAMHGALLRGLHQEIENVLQTVPDIVTWSQSAPRS